jgi:hypothetical protein
MARCDVCGNDYDMSFQVTAANGSHFVFDSLECAMQRLAPICGHCGCKIIGHGIDTDRGQFCCAHCARESGVDGATDRVGEVSRKPLIG